MTIIQWISLSLSVIGLVVWSLYIALHPRRWGFGVAPISWFVNLIAFYLFLAVNLSRLDAGGIAFVNQWSSLVRLHGILLILGIGVVELAARTAWLKLKSTKKTR